MFQAKFEPEDNSGRFVTILGYPAQDINRILNRESACVSVTFEEIPVGLVLLTCADTSAEFHEAVIDIAYDMGLPISKVVKRETPTPDHTMRAMSKARQLRPRN